MNRLFHRLLELASPASASAISQRGLCVALARFVAEMPALGNVLYVPMCPNGMAAQALPRGVLVEAMQLAPLLQTRRLVAASAITVEGPREWIDCVDREGRICARLHLLPDTDYLAWDRLLACGKPMVATPARWLRPPRPASARVLRFQWRRLAGLGVLGADMADGISPLSRQLAGQIARAEAVPLQLAGD
jgi:hypothetical protein